MELIQIWLQLFGVDTFLESAENGTEIVLFLERLIEFLINIKSVYNDFADFTVSK